jgi:short-subunit dehydrogenase
MTNGDAPGAIVIGASSGIGRALAIKLSADGYRVGLVARRTELLTELARQLPKPGVVKTIDVSQPDVAMPLLQSLVDELGDVEVFIVSAGVGFENDSLAWVPERDTIAVNVAGFAAMVNVAAAHLASRGSGYLVGISSLAALAGNAVAPAYSASKAFASNYLDGVRYRFGKLKLPITVTDIQAGFVDTAMARSDTLFWVASPEKAAEQILAAMRRRARRAYVTKRWRLVAWLLKGLPDWALRKL